MAERLVIRYYPVDGEYNGASTTSCSFGIALWFRPPLNPTMGALTGSISNSEIGVRYAGNSASVVYFDVYELSEGEFAEQEIYLLSPASDVLPVTLASLPIEVAVAGLGVEPNPSSSQTRAWVADSYSTGGYAGGAIEIGLYVDADYIPLSSFWVDGEFFTAKYDGTSWDNPVLPQPTDLYRKDEEGGVLYITLSTNATPPTFWTQLRRSVETP